MEKLILKTPEMNEIYFMIKELDELRLENQELKILEEVIDQKEK